MSSASHGTSKACRVSLARAVRLAPRDPQARRGVWARQVQQAVRVIPARWAPPGLPVRSEQRVPSVRRVHPVAPARPGPRATPEPPALTVRAERLDLRVPPERAVRRVTPGRLGRQATSPASTTWREGLAI